MDSKNLNTFIQVAELKSFTKAAEKLGYTQSTVSFQIKQLESELGVTLFDRINHTISLTEDGKGLLRTAHGINQLLRDYVMSVSDSSEVSGHVRLVMANSLRSLLIGQIFPRLRENYPGITLEIAAAGTAQMFNQLNHNDMDLVFTLDSHIYDANYKILDEHRIGTHFVCSTQHRLAGKTVSIDQVLKEPFLLTEKNMSYRKILDERLAADSYEISPILETGSTSLIIELVRENCGISFLPDYSSKPSLDQGQMSYIYVPNFEIEVWTQLLVHRDKWVSPQMKVIIDLLKEVSVALK